MAALAPRPKILVVDDEPIIAQLITDVLSGEGYDVDVASDGLIALEHIDRDAYDLILSDLRMPGLDGLGLYRQLEQNRPELARRFVFITGTSEHTDYAGLIGDLPVPVLTKPFDMSALQRVARETLATSVS
ncbi:MAG TPA: response regulator [Methylomirabilota bacterium]|nr:response regulator [Methylomirabilota bacterium]